MRTLIIEWNHLDVEGETCDRCYDTGENLNQEIKRLNRSLNQKDIEVQLKENLISEDEIALSNTILFNGVAIEDIIDIKVKENYCQSCSDLTGRETYCRTIIYDGNEYDEIPAKAIRHAALLALNLNEDNNKPKCNCNSKGCC